jgi:hypothetical protein
MGLLDVLTGGKSSDAAKAMEQAQMAFANVKAPSEADLTLPELQKYVQQGLLTPAQAEAVLNKQNAYDTTAVPTEGRNAQIAALNQLQEIGNEKGMDATAQAQTQQTLNALNTNMQGQRGAILDSFAQRGVPLSLASEAMQNQVLGQDAQSANANALQANADAQMRALQALQGSATVGGNVQQQDWNQANTKAAAQNAINQWNSQVANAANENNAARQQQANTYNTGTKQDVANQNVGNANYRTEYNAKVPQQVFSNAIQKAGGQASAYTNAGNLANSQGQQQYGMVKDIAGGVAGFMQPSGATSQAPGAAKGGIVPGEARVDGDSPANDTVSARLSPGELVVPRSLVKEFLGNMPKKHNAPHPEDVKNVLHAMAEMRDKAEGEGMWGGGCAKGYATGGIVENEWPPKFNVSPLTIPPLRGDLTAGSSTQPLMGAPETPAPAPASLPVAPAAPVASAAPKPAPMAPIAPPAAANDDGMANYLASLRSKMDEYGPDKQKAVADYLMKQQGGIGNRIGQALANFGGVGQQYSQANQQKLENAMKIGKEYNEGKLGQLESGMKIDTMDPKSPVSRQAQQTYAPLFDKLGYPKGTAEKMSASEIKSALAQAIEYGGKEAENKIKQWEAEQNIDIRKGVLAQSQAEAGQRQASEAEKLKQNAAEDVLKDTSWNPFAGSSFAARNAARQTLAQQAGVAPATGETSKAPPYGEVTEKNGVQYKWSPITQKYHKVQQ